MGEEKQNTSKLSFASDAFDNEKYTFVARRAQLRELALVNSRYNIKLPQLQEALVNDSVLKPGFSGEPGESSFHDDVGVVIGEYRWTASIKLGRTSLVNLSADFIVLYEGLAGAEKDYVELYFEKLARFATYPYFRSFFSLCTANSGVTLSPLPSLIDRVD